MLMQQKNTYPTKDFLLGGGESLERSWSQKTGPELRHWKTNQWQKFLAQGLPSPRVEEWKYTDLSALVKKPFQPAMASEEAQLSEWSKGAEDRESWPEEQGEPGPTLVFINGHWSQSLSDLKAWPQQVKLLTIEEALLQDPSRLAHLENFSQIYEDAFSRLNGAAWGGALWIEVDPQVKVSQTVRILHWNEPGQGRELRGSRVVLWLGEQSEVRLVEKFVGSSGEAKDSDSSMVNSVLDLHLSAGSRLRSLQIQQQPQWLFHFSQVRARLEKDSHWESFSLTQGGRRSRLDLYADLIGTGAEALVNGLYFAKDKNQSDHRTLIRHLSPHSQSEQLYKGVVGEKGEASFNGKIYIAPQAQQVASQQLNKNLLLSETAEVHSKPELEVYADNVKANHGSAVGQVNPDQLFYLMSRGLRREEATQLLIQGFVSDVIFKLESPEWQRWLQSLVGRSV